MRNSARMKRMHRGDGNRPPVASNVTISGAREVGSLLTGTYTYFDPNGDPESGSTYQWYRADDGAGTNRVAIGGETATTYTVVLADAGKYVGFEVTPSDGTLFGTPAVSYGSVAAKPRIAYIDATIDSLRTYEFDYSNWTLVGSGLTITGSSSGGCAALSSTSIALSDDTLGTLTKYAFSGSAWAQVGNTLVIPGVLNTTAVAALSASSVVWFDAGNDQLRVYSFDGADWSQVGTGTAIAGVSTSTTLATAVLSPTRIVMGFTDFGDSTTKIRVYDLSGGVWSQVGNTLSFATTGSYYITALTSTRIAIALAGLQALRTYDFDGTNFALVGNSFATGVIGVPSLSALSSSKVVMDDGATDTLRAYSFDGTDWSALGSGLVITGAGGPRTDCLTYAASGVL